MVKHRFLLRPPARAGRGGSPGSARTRCPHSRTCAWPGGAPAHGRRSRCAGSLGIALAAPAAASADTVVVGPDTPGWASALESGTTAAATFRAGPGAPPLGSGSAGFTVGDGASGVALATAQHAATRLADLTALGYSTYVTSAPGPQAVALQLDVDYDATDADESYQGRLVYEPYQNGAVVPGGWQAWHTLAGSWWASREPGRTACPQSDPCSWSELLGAFPDAAIGGALLLKAGSGWSGFDGAADALTVNDDTYDLEGPLGPCPASDSGTTITLLADCTTDHTLLVPDGHTLDGDAHAITAVDPAGGHFVGAVVSNAGGSANVTDVTITASGLDEVCDGGDDRLRGILLDGASGAITGVAVHGVRQGPSGCQEGNAIEARNVNEGAPERAVEIAGNAVLDYQKNGITVNGMLSALVEDNAVTGDGPVQDIAQNGIQVGFGASALVQRNAVSGNWYTGPADAVSCGLLVFEANGVKQKTNSLTGNQVDFCNFGRGGGNVKPQP